MSERDRSLPCGCRYINTPGPVGNSWWHVVSCPEHTLHMHPLAEVPDGAADGMSGFRWPEASEECEVAQCDRCAGCDCPCHEDPPVPGGPPMRDGNNPRTGIAWNE